MLCFGKEYTFYFPEASCINRKTLSQCGISPTPLEWTVALQSLTQQLCLCAIEHLKQGFLIGMATHVYNPSTLEMEEEGC